MTYGISTWSLHRTLASGKISLLDVPAALNARGMSDLQICHFHIESTAEKDLAALRERIAENGITLDAVLIDFGDLSSDTAAERDGVEMERWLAVAAKLGARHARISAGASAPSDETLTRSASHLLRLADIGDRLGVKVITENWHAMMMSPREVERIVELTNGRVPLCLDFGNWSGASKYDDLESIAPFAVTVHAKCAFAAADTPDAADFARCCEILKRANYAGTLALIYDGPSDDEWCHIAQELTLARAAFAT